MAVVLVIDDEDDLRASMVRALSDLDTVETIEAANMAQASHALDRCTPDLVLADIDLPDRSGIEILGELGKRGQAAPVVFISAYVRAYRAQIPRNPRIDVMEKPISLAQLKEMVQQRVHVAPAPAGAAEETPFGPSDFIQIACLGRHTVTVEVTSRGQVVGTVLIKEGELWSARAGEVVGEGAIRQLLFAEEGFTRCRALHDVAEERTIHRGWEHVLLDAAREEDEEAETALLDDPPEASPAVVAPEPAPEDPEEMAFRRHWETAVDALLAKDYPSALAAFTAAAAIRPDDPRVATNLARLRDLGHGVDLD